MEIRSHGDGSAWEHDKIYKEKANGSGCADGRGGDAGGYGDVWGDADGCGDGEGVQTSNGFEEWNFKIK